jgi:hypothetical protein
MKDKATTPKPVAAAVRIAKSTDAAPNSDLKKPVKYRNTRDLDANQLTRSGQCPSVTPIGQIKAHKMSRTDRFLDHLAAAWILIFQPFFVNCPTFSALI